MTSTELTAVDETRVQHPTEHPAYRTPSPLSAWSSSEQALILQGRVFYGTVLAFGVVAATMRVWFSL